MVGFVYRYEKVQMKSLQRGDFLDDVSRNLNNFNVQVEHFEQWYRELIEQLESRDLDKLGHEEYAHRVEQLAARKDKQRPQFDELIANGKNLIAKKDITDVSVVRDKIKVSWQKQDSYGFFLQDGGQLTDLALRLGPLYLPGFLV